MTHLFSTITTRFNTSYTTPPLTPPSLKTRDGGVFFFSFTPPSGRSLARSARRRVFSKLCGLMVYDPPCGTVMQCSYLKLLKYI
jgi:hypothetical protein